MPAAKAAVRLATASAMLCTGANPRSRVSLSDDYVVGTQIVGRLGDDFDVPADHAARHLGQVGYATVLVSGVEDAAVDPLVRVFKAADIEVGHVFDVWNGVQS